MLTFQDILADKKTDISAPTPGTGTSLGKMVGQPTALL